MAVLPLLTALSLFVAAPESFEPLPVPTDAGPIERALGDQPDRIWQEGDVLTIARRSAEGMVSLTGGIQRPLERVANSDVWVLRLRRSDWSPAFFSYAFFEGSKAPISFREWRGANAPAAPAKATALGKVETIELPGRALGEPRKVTVYLPPGAKPGIAALVLADGQSAAGFAPIVQALIDAKKVRPLAIIGIHSGGFRGQPGAAYDPKLDYRAREYLAGGDGSRFRRHLDWVVDEVLPEMARRFGISRRRADVGVAGFSNGGVFATAAAFRRPDVFGVAIPMSVGAPPPAPTRPLDVRFFFCAGELEAGFLRGTTTAYEAAKSRGAEARLRTYVSGHDPAMWQLGLAEALPEAFP